MSAGTNLLDALQVSGLQGQPIGDQSQSSGPPSTQGMGVQGRPTPQLGTSPMRAALDIQNMEDDIATQQQAKAHGGMWTRLLGNLLGSIGETMGNVGAALHPEQHGQAAQVAQLIADQQKQVQAQQQNQFRNQMQSQQMGMDTESHQYKMANMQLSLARLNRDLEQMPQTRQQSYEDEFRKTIIAPLYKDFPEMLQKEGSADGGDMYELRDEAMRMNQQEKTMDYVVGPSMSNAKGYAIYKMPHSRTQEDEEIDLGKGQKVTVPKGTPIITRNQLVIQAAEKKVNNDLRQSLQNAREQTRIQIANIAHQDRQAAMALASTRPQDQAAHDEFITGMHDLEVQRAEADRNGYMDYGGDQTKFAQFYQQQQQQLVDTLKKSISAAPSVKSTNQAFKVPEGAPQAPKVDGSKLKDKSGNVIAVSKGGQWIAPSSQ